MTREELGITKLVMKIPMQKMVIDDENNLFTYSFVCKGIDFRRFGSVMIVEKNNEEA